MAVADLPSWVVHSAITDGRAYFINKIFIIPSNGSSNIHIDNPNGDRDKEVWFAEIDVIANQGTQTWIHDWFDTLSSGTEIAVQNARMDSSGGPPDTGEFHTYYNSEFTESEHGSYPIAITSSGGPPEIVVASLFPMLLEPGRDLILEVINMEDQEQVVLISIFLIEGY